jgi:cell division protein FtsQ
MDLFERFLTELDSGTEKVSQTISEVDLSSPEDVKALLATGSGPQASDILVHFGSEDFLPRYQKFQERLPEWKAQYPKLASVDMRYDRQVVLEMAPGSAAPGEAKPSAAPSKSAASAKPIAKPAAKGAKLPAKAPAHAALKPAHPVKPTPAASRPAAKPTPTQASPQ